VTSFCLLAGEPGAEDSGGGVGTYPRNLRRSHLQSPRYSQFCVFNAEMDLFYSSGGLVKVI
jgi:hypothetical protein